jgi:hypothetical protein
LAFINRQTWHNKGGGGGFKFIQMKGTLYGEIKARVEIHRNNPPQFQSNLIQIILQYRGFKLFK